MALREMLLKLGVDVDKKSEQQALSGLDKIKAAAKLVAAAFAAIKSAQVFLAVTDEIRGLADEIDKTSQQLGLSAQALEEFRHAANLSGVAGREMSDTLGKLQKNAFEAATGNKTLAEDFARLGVNVKDANGEVKSAEILIAEMADGFAGLDNETEKVGLSLNLMGRAGRKLLPLLNAGSEGIAEMRQEARDLGGVFGDELIAKSVQLTDDQARLEFAIRGLKASIATELMPTIIETTQRMIDFAKSMRGPLSTAIRFVRRIIDGFTQAAVWLSDKWGIVGEMLVGLTGIATTLGLTFLLVGKNAFIAAAKTAAAWVIAQAPLFLTIALLGIIIASILLVIEDLQAMGEGAESVSGTIAQGFLDSIDELGSWSEAVKDIFATTFEFWLGVSRETFHQIAAVIEEAVGTLLAPVEATIGMIINLFGSLITFFSDVFTAGVTTAFSNLWDNLRGMAQDLVDDVMSFFKPLFTFIGKGISVVADIVGIEREGGAETPGIGERVTEAAAAVTRTAAPGTNVAGVSPAVVFPPAAGMAPGASVVNNPQTDIKIDVDARGREGSGEVGQDIARAVDEVIQRRDRQTLQAYLQAAGSS
jgi:hypothetical protein